MKNTRLLIASKFCPASFGNAILKTRFVKGGGPRSHCSAYPALCRARPLQATGPETAMQEKKTAMQEKKVALQETGPKLQCNFFVLPLSRKNRTVESRVGLARLPPHFSSGTVFTTDPINCLRSAYYTLERHGAMPWPGGPTLGHTANKRG